ncbi:putative mitochondrial protein [Andalucia godoyi]|uniref:Putative mitochondrial protein n=1 Tax=Andalucia godoyi TaxID=505711 RepID=A0A8K0F2A6_ANDGO|nr:putative mitochondrial protein [Andalucia godoyi]|eukprot:ANDGO_08633.mRNA.1 putative mitochondrial protein
MMRPSVNRHFVRKFTHVIRTMQSGRRLAAIRTNAVPERDAPLQRPRGHPFERTPMHKDHHPPELYMGNSSSTASRTVLPKTQDTEPEAAFDKQVWQTAGDLGQDTTVEGKKTVVVIAATSESSNDMASPMYFM